MNNLREARQQMYKIEKEMLTDRLKFAAQTANELARVTGFLTKVKRDELTTPTYNSEDAAKIGLIL